MQLQRNRDRAKPPDGIWMPQVDTALRDGWPDGYTALGVGAIRVLFQR
jgi:hypothetical protein